MSVKPDHHQQLNKILEILAFRKKIFFAVQTQSFEFKYMSRDHSLRISNAGMHSTYAMKILFLGVISLENFQNDRLCIKFWLDILSSW